MLARAHQPPPLGILPNLTAAAMEPTSMGASMLADWTPRFIAQFAAPSTQHLVLERDGRTEHLLIDVTSGAWATVFQDDGRWLARQGGPERLWDKITGSIEDWKLAGEPPPERLRLQIGSSGHTLTWD